jgi:hypothetical protein
MTAPHDVKNDIKCPYCRKLYGRTNLDVEVQELQKDLNIKRHIEINCECGRLYWVVSK